jgi:hypothetical protein
MNRLSMSSPFSGVVVHGPASSAYDGLLVSVYTDGYDGVIYEIVAAARRFPELNS